MQRYEEALKHLASSRKITSGLSSECSLDNNEDFTLNNIGKCLMNLHRYGEAIKIFHEALNLQEQLVFKQDLVSNKVLALNNLSLCLSEMNNLKDSFFYLGRAYDLCSQALASGLSFGQETRKQMADTLNNIGLNFMKIKAYCQAINCFDDSLSYYNSILTTSENCEDVYLVWNNLGLSYMSIKQPQKAISHFKIALEFFEASTFSNYAEIKIAALCNNIGLCLMRCKLYNHSLHFFVKSLSLYQKSTPSTNQDVGAVIHNIALVYMNLEKLEESFEFLKNGLDLYQNSCGDPNTDQGVAEILHSMGLCKKRMGEFAEGLSYFEQSAIIQALQTPSQTDAKDMIKLLYNSGICLLAFDQNEKSSFKKTHCELTLKCLKDFTSVWSE